MNHRFLGLRTHGIRVPELDKAKQWYTQALGCEPYFDQPFYVGFSVAGYELGLMPAESPWQIGALGAAVYWGVDDMQSALDALLALGATLLEPSTDVGDGIFTAMVLDPWGNAFGLIVNPHFGGH